MAVDLADEVKRAKTADSLTGDEGDYPTITDEPAPPRDQFETVDVGPTPGLEPIEPSAESTGVSGSW